MPPAPTFPGLYTRAKRAEMEAAAAENADRVHEIAELPPSRSRRIELRAAVALLGAIGLAWVIAIAFRFA